MLQRPGGRWLKHVLTQRDFIHRNKCLLHTGIHWDTLWGIFTSRHLRGQPLNAAAGCCCCWLIGTFEGMLDATVFVGIQVQKAAGYVYYVENDQLQFIKTFLLLGHNQLKEEDEWTAAPIRGHLRSAPRPEQATWLAGWLASWLGVSLLLP